MLKILILVLILINFIVLINTSPLKQEIPQYQNDDVIITSAFDNCNDCLDLPCQLESDQTCSLKSFQKNDEYVRFQLIIKSVENAWIGLVFNSAESPGMIGSNVIMLEFSNNNDLAYNGYLKYYNTPFIEDSKIQNIQITKEDGKSIITFDRKIIINSINVADTQFDFNKCNYIAVANGKMSDNIVLQHLETPKFSNECYNMVRTVTKSVSLALITEVEGTSKLDSISTTTTTIELSTISTKTSTSIPDLTATTTTESSTTTTETSTSTSDSIPITTTALSTTTRTSTATSTLITSTSDSTSTTTESSTIKPSTISPTITTSLSTTTTIESSSTMTESTTTTIKSTTKTSTLPPTTNTTDTLSTSAITTSTLTSTTTLTSIKSTSPTSTTIKSTLIFSTTTVRTTTTLEPTTESMTTDVVPVGGDLIDYYYTVDMKIYEKYSSDLEDQNSQAFKYLNNRKKNFVRSSLKGGFLNGYEDANIISVSEAPSNNNFDQIQTSTVIIYKDHIERNQITLKNDILGALKKGNTSDLNVVPNSISIKQQEMSDKKEDVSLTAIILPSILGSVVLILIIIGLLLAYSCYKRSKSYNLYEYPKMEFVNMIRI